MSETENEDTREHVPNPVSRAMLQERFVDDKWWTSAGIAAALGSALPDDLAVRFYKYRRPDSLTHESLSVLITAARNLCVGEVLRSMNKAHMDTRKQEGVRLYKFKAPGRQRLGVKNSQLKPQSRPALTRTGLTVPGLLAAITQLGNPCSVEQLVAVLTPAMIEPDKLIAWFKKVCPQKMKPRLGQMSADELLSEARRHAVTRVIGFARILHPVKTFSRLYVEYTPPSSDEARLIPFPADSP